MQTRYEHKNRRKYSLKVLNYMVKKGETALLPPAKASGFPRPKTVMKMYSDFNNTTKDILYQISRHLSRRRDCRGIEYAVWITPEVNGYSQIIMNPVVYVYRNNAERKLKYTIVSHVLSDHFPMIKYDKTKSMIEQHKDNYVVPGFYVYRKSFRTGKRKWQIKYLMDQSL